MTSALPTRGSLSRYVAAERRRQGLTQTDLARMAGRGQQWLSTLERGRSDPATGDVMAVLDALGARVELRGAEPSEP